MQFLASPDFWRRLRAVPGGWITPPQSAASVQQHARHQSTINGLWMKEDRFTTFRRRWRPGDAASDAAGRQGWGEAARGGVRPNARALIGHFSVVRPPSESGKRRIVHARTCVKECSRDGFHCAWLQSVLCVFGVYFETMAVTARLQQQGGGSSITEKSPHANMHGHGPQPWEVSTCGVWPISSPPIFRGLGPAQYGSVSFVRAFSALPVQRGVRTPCHPHAPSICIRT